jgi:hypothetical protein
MVVLAAAAAGLWFATVAGASGSPSVDAPAPPSALVAAVKADGIPVGLASGWHVTKVDVGRYRLDFSAPVDLHVQSWDAAATVTLREVRDHEWLVDFVDEHALVDSAFSFTAAPKP